VAWPGWSGRNRDRPGTSQPPRNVLGSNRATSLPQPDARLVAVGELNAGLFQGALDGFDGARLQGLAGLEAHDGAGRDMGQLGQIADAQFQSGSRHAHSLHEIAARAK
jgi:hypothetical protein